MKALKTKTVMLVALLGLMSACPKDKPQGWTSGEQKPVETGEVKTLFKKVGVQEYGISLSVPEDWTVKKGMGNPVVMANAPGADANGPSSNVVVEGITQRMAPYDYLEANLITMQISLPDLKILQRGTGLHSGIQMAWMLYTYPREDVPVAVLTYCQTKDYRAYVVTCICPRESFDEYKGVFVKIGQSLRVK